MHAYSIRMIHTSIRYCCNLKATVVVVVVLRWIVFAFGGFLEVLAGNAHHGGTLPTGYPGTRPITKPAGFGSDPDSATGRTRPGG